MRRDHFDIAIRLPMRVPDINHRGLSGLSVNFGRGFGVHHRVERVLTRDPVLIGTIGELHPHK